MKEPKPLDMSVHYEVQGNIAKCMLAAAFGTRDYQKLYDEYSKRLSTSRLMAIDQELREEHALRASLQFFQSA